MNINILNSVHQANLDKLENLLRVIVEENNNSLLLHNVYADLYLDTEEGRIVRKGHIEEIFLTLENELYIRYNFEDESIIDEVWGFSYDELYGILYSILENGIYENTKTNN